MNTLDGGNILQVFLSSLLFFLLFVIRRSFSARFYALGVVTVELVRSHGTAMRRRLLHLKLQKSPNQAIC